MFIDSARITVHAGRGGNGCVSFRREKFVPRGGPNGGDGGNGGSVVLRAEEGLNTLLHLQHKRVVRAKPGSHGGGSNKTGACGESVTLGVPVGTVVRDGESGELLGDLVENGQELFVARGGKGGRGNARFSTPENRAPRKAEDGRPGESRELSMELKLLADVGLVGLPNAGKSTLLSRVSAARPKVADYPFTTLEPHLGVVQSPAGDYDTIVLADIPGLIDGAHEGAGLGIQFLRHVERCRVLAHLVDLSSEESILERVETIRGEISAYSLELSQRPWVLIGTKLDAVADRDAVVHDVERVAKGSGVPCRTISAVTGEGLKEMIGLLFRLTEDREFED